jgi:hypothetical protein
VTWQAPTARLNGESHAGGDAHDRPVFTFVLPAPWATGAGATTPAARRLRVPTFTNNGPAFLRWDDGGHGLRRCVGNTANATQPEVTDGRAEVTLENPTGNTFQTMAPTPHQCAGCAGHVRPG